MKNVELFKIIYNTHFEQIYRSTFLVSQNEQIARDAVQEAFITAFKNLHLLKDLKNPHAWIAAVASNKAIDMIRKDLRSVPVKDIDFLGTDEFVKNSPYKFVHKELEIDILKGLKQLDLKYREIIVMKYYYNLTEEEIHEFLNIPVGTVKSRLYRARQLLKNILQPGNDSEGIL